MGTGRCRGITRRWGRKLQVGSVFREQGHGKEGEAHKKEDALWVLSEVSDYAATEHSATEEILRY